MTPTCPCGNPVGPRGKKFCSKSCSGRYGGGLRRGAPDCAGCGADLTVEANVYRYKSGPREGQRRCRRCVLAKGKPDHVPAPKNAPKPPSEVRRPRPKPKPVPTPVAAPEAPAWRPPGWAPVPNVGRRAS